MIAIRLRKDLERRWYGLRRRGDLDDLSERSDLSERCDFSERVIGRSWRLCEFQFLSSLNQIQNRGRNLQHNGYASDQSEYASNQSEYDLICE